MLPHNGCERSCKPKTTEYTLLLSLSREELSNMLASGKLRFIEQLIVSHREEGVFFCELPYSLLMQLGMTVYLTVAVVMEYKKNAIILLSENQWETVIDGFETLLTSSSFSEKQTVKSFFPIIGQAVRRVLEEPHSPYDSN